MINFNNIDNLYALKEEFSNALDKLIESQQVSDKLDTFKNLNFSDLITLFEGVSDTIVDVKGGKSIVRKYVNILKESDSLNKAYSINKLLSNGHNNGNNDLFIKESFELCNSVNKSEYKNDVSKLADIVSEAVRLSKINVAEINALLENKNKMLNSVDYLFENKKTFKNVSEYVKNMSVISDYLNENISCIKETENTNNFSDLINELNESVDATDEQWKKELIERLTICELSNTHKSSLFNEYKNECLNLITRVVESKGIDTEFKSKMLTMESRLSSKEYNEDKFIEDISNLAELKNTLSEPWQEE